MISFAGASGRGFARFVDLLRDLHLSFASGEYHLHNCIEASVLHRTEELVDLIACRRVAELFLHLCQTQQRVETNQPNVPSVPRAPYLGFKITGVLPPCRDQN